MVAKMVYRNFHLMLPNRVTHGELLELDILDFYVIFGDGWFAWFFDSIDCRTTIVKFNFYNEPVL